MVIDTVRLLGGLDLMIISMFACQLLWRADLKVGFSQKPASIVDRCAIGIIAIAAFTGGLHLVSLL